MADAGGDPIPTSSVLMAASKHVAAGCRAENLAFINCKKKDPNPEKCLEKGREVTRCVLSLYCKIVEADHIFFIMSRERAGMQFDVMYDDIFGRCRKHAVRTMLPQPSHETPRQ